MKASNWLFDYVRHTRPGDRTYKVGKIEAVQSGLHLTADGKYMTIELSREEMIELKRKLNTIIIFG